MIEETDGPAKTRGRDSTPATADPRDHAAAAGRMTTLRSDAAPIVLRPPRFALRLLDAAQPAHARAYRDLYTCPEVMATVAPPLEAAAADRAFIAACGHNVLARPGHRYWAIHDLDAGEVAGLAALQRSGDRAEFGAMLQPAWWGRRIAHGSLEALARHAFAAMAVAAIDVRCTREANVPVVQRLVAPFGFRRAPRPERMTEGACWTLDHADWQASTGTIRI